MSADREEFPAVSQPTNDVAAELQRLADEIVEYWKREFGSYLDEKGRRQPTDRPIAALVADLLELPGYGSENARHLIASYVNRMTGHSISQFDGRRILLAASESGVWASEMCIPASMLMAAGYEVVVATETGARPHMLSVSVDPTFIDKPLGIPVVSKEEAELAARFMSTNTEEAKLLEPGRLRALKDIIRPPLVSDYVENQARTMQELHQGVCMLAEWVTQFDALIVAGGSGAVAGFAMNGGLHHLLLGFNRLDRPIVAECNGVFALVQAIDPATNRSVLDGRLATTHSVSHEYRRGGWGWAKAGEAGEEVWTMPGHDGNPIIDSEPFVRNAVGTSGRVFSPPATPYAVAVDRNIITARTTPDGGPATAALIALLEGWSPQGCHFATDESGFRRA